MFKFAYIINMPGYSPETYCGEYEDAESYNIVVGTDGVEGAKAFAQKLEEENFDLINLCSDFDDQAREAVSASMKNPIEVQNAHYFPEELEKLEALEEPVNYGVIIQVDGDGENVCVALDSPDCNTRAFFVKDMENAKNAAADLVAGGIDFIELCGWFDEEMTREIIAAAGGEVPVGSCGI